MIVLLPVSAFRVEYEVGHGRPFSGLEALVLRAVGEGARNLDDLVGSFRISPRLLVEALVTLTHAGWIAVGSPSQADFILTAEGKAAAESGDAPRSFAASDRAGLVVMERVSGALAAGRDVRFATRPELERVWYSCFRLPIDIVDNRLDEGQVQGLLPLARGEWLRWVESIEMTTKGGTWLPLSVNVESGVVLGLPAAWERRLRGDVLAQAAAKAKTLPVDAVRLSWRVTTPRREISEDAPRLPNEWCPIDVREGDLVLTHLQHVSLMKDVFERASTKLLVSSAFMTQRAIEELRPHLLGALQRGVHVDLLWGYAAEDGAALEKLRKTVREIRKSGVPGRVHFNAVPSESHAKLLVWDEDSVVKACLGSFNWLSSPGSAGSLSHEVSVVLNEPALLARICRCVAAFWAGVSTETLTTARDRWLRLALDLDQLPRNPHVEGKAMGKLLVDHEIDGWFREALMDAENRLLVTSHRLGRAAPIRLQRAVGRTRPTEFELRAYYGSAQEKAVVTETTVAINAAGGSITELPALHAKVVVRDDLACVGSYNFLAADPYGKASGGRELAIVVNDGAVANALAATVRRWGEA